MNKLALLFLVAVLASVASYSLYHTYRAPDIPEHERVFQDLQWLRTEFDLDHRQWDAIAAIYEEYRPVCEALCLRVMDAQANLNRLSRNAESVTSELEDALEVYTRVKEECHRAMLEHVYAVASHMEPGQRERYLGRAIAHVTMHDPVR